MTSRIRVSGAHDIRLQEELVADAIAMDHWWRHGVERSKSFSAERTCSVRSAFCSLIFQFLAEEKNQRQFQTVGTPGYTLFACYPRADWNNSQVRTTIERLDRTACSTSIGKIIHLKLRSYSPRLKSRWLVYVGRKALNVSIHRGCVRWKLQFHSSTIQVPVQYPFR